jgi:8-oxo-dGTP diphosphatase
MPSTENINTKISTIQDYFKSAISVDCVIFGYDEHMEELQVLTLKCDMQPYVGHYSLVGDLVSNSENLEEAAERVLSERAGIKDVFLKQVHTFGNKDRHPVGRVISVAYYALIKIDDFKLQQSNVHHPSWMTISSLRDENMAFDHNEILNKCLDHIRKNIIDLPVEYMLPYKFTLSQLQSLYEAILNKKLDKRNFRKKIQKLNLIVDTKDYQENVAHRPAKLYQINKKATQII